MSITDNVLVGVKSVEDLRGKVWPLTALKAECLLHRQQAYL
jgi:hypothetical protein